jgi:hypothetical protein
VKENRVYGIAMSVFSGETWLAAIYLAPLFHPDIFSDFNAQNIHQEYLDRFMGGTEKVSQGVFLYPSA